MNTGFIPIDDVKQLYPDEWVLLGNPEIKSTRVLSGIVLYHSKDKKEVCYLGRDKTAGFSTVTIAFTGKLNQNRKIGILKSL